VIQRRLLAAAFALVLVPFAFVHPVRISGRSMEPLLRDGEVRLALRAWCAGRPRLGQVWLAATPGGTVVKRLVAPPGSRVELRDGELWINGKYLPEPYLARTERASGGPWQTGEGWFLLGDNRTESHDSRAFGPLSAMALEARLLD
jgi:signal peptidase I